MLERTGPAPRSGAALGNATSGLQRILSGRNGTSGNGVDAYAPNAVAETWEQTYRLLRAATNDDANIRVLHNQVVAHVGQNDDHAWARTADGTVHEGELLVGADGHRSVVRRLVAPDKPDATYAGYVIWLGIAEESELDVAAIGRRWPSGLDIRDAGPDCLLGYPLGPHDGSLGGGRRLGWAWFDPRRTHLLRETGCVAGDVVQHSMRPADVPANTLAELDDEARQWPSPWREAIRDCLRRRAVTGTPIAEYLPDRLTSGRVALVGDAGHVSTPMTGRGFAVAVSDAETLAEELAKHPAGTGILTALHAYEQRRLGPARDVVTSGQAFSRSFKLST
ncbi:FAD-dependent monooxygenase [Nocardioides oleivorans]|uniref:FAD-dependent monooxygenase n=1 Tax=Nocardioides oleivorans TaxID=273676 RepID=UPI001A921EFB|nr:FAD-dependent monooxygenase [Nocardioides oleivorans]